MNPVLCVFLLLGLGACEVPSIPTPSPSVSPSHSQTPGASPSASVVTPSPSVSASPSVLPSVTPSPLASPSPRISEIPVATDAKDDSCQGVATGGWSQDANGWTVIPPASARVIFVSATNTVKQDGQTYFVKTTADGIALLRKGQPDQLFFKRGESFPTFTTTNLGGLSQAKPMVIGAYGSGERPIIQGGINFGGQAFSNLILVSLDFEAPTPGADNAIFTANSNEGDGVTARSKSFLMEDLKVAGFNNGMSIQSPTKNPGYENVSLRRSIIVDNFPGGDAHSQGIYLDGIKGILLEENVFDHNGWKTRGQAPGRSTQYNHNNYIMALNKCFTARGNIYAQGSATGLQARSGGIVENNVFLRNPLHLTYGLVNGGSVQLNHIPIGVSGVVSKNVFWESTDISGVAGEARGNHVTLGNIKHVLLTDNLIQGYMGLGPKNYSSAFSMEADMGIGIHSVKVVNFPMLNTAAGILKSGKGYGPVVVQLDGSIQNTQGVTVIAKTNATTGEGSGIPPQAQLIGIPDTGLDLSGIQYQTSAPVKVSLATYLGKPTLTSDQALSQFLAGARANRKGAWDVKFTASPLSSYLRDGFRK